MSDMDRENAYYATLPRCCWCRDVIDENDGQECERCSHMACVDHCSASLNGEIICLECKDAEWVEVRKIA